MLELHDERKIIKKTISDSRNMFLTANFPSIRPRMRLNLGAFGASVSSPPTLFLIRPLTVSSQTTDNIDAVDPLA